MAKIARWTTAMPSAILNNRPRLLRVSAQDWLRESDAGPKESQVGKPGWMAPGKADGVPEGEPTLRRTWLDS